MQVSPHERTDAQPAPYEPPKIEVLGDLAAVTQGIGTPGSKENVQGASLV